MISKLVNAWDKNKNNLETYFRETPQSQYSNYRNIIEKVLEIVVNPYLKERSFDIKNITEVDNGDYQGTLIFLIPIDWYQPCESDYVVTYVSYGSCSGCDTLLAISEYDIGYPTEKQVKDYMTLALHLLQHAKWLYDNRYGGEAWQD